MKTTMSKWTTAALAAVLMSVGCAETMLDEPVVDGKPEDVVDGGGKEDRWNYQNNPNRFNGEFVTELAQLPREGRAETLAWPSSYFPTYMDSINDRWQGDAELSPAEKYDRAFNGWTPAEDFMTLRPFQPDSCESEFDTDYYSSLGPLANYVSANMGNARARNGRDDDGDGEADNCGDNLEHDGVETWWGLCHAWVPASMLEDRPLRAVTHNGVTFETGDLEALLIAAYNRTAADMIGDRCRAGANDDNQVERDEQGRAVNVACRDTNAGSFHIVMTNRLGVQHRPFAFDRTYDYEVWNQPVTGFEVTGQDEISVERALELLGTEGDSYTFNEDAVTLYDVHASVRWITEAHASTRPSEASQYERTDRYTYILEIDANGDIIGGEWYGSSRERHPDFLWDPRRITRSSVPFLDVDNVRMLIQMSREDEVPPVDGDVMVFTSGNQIHIPDNDRTGVVSVQDIEDAVTIRSLQVELDITHTYVGDLKVVLSHGDVETVLHANEGAGRDNIQVTVPVSAFDGMSTQGVWTLSIVDSAARDTGSLNRWRLLVTPSDSSGGDDPDTGTDDHFVNRTGVAIPDNNTEGISSEIRITDSDVVAGRLRIDLDVTHTYIGDLVIDLSHGGVTHTLHSRSGGATHDIRTTLEASAFEGQRIAGTWTLRVRDLAGRDTGTLNSWGLRFLPKDDEGPADAEPERFAGEGGLSIPDNNEAGIRSLAVVPNDVTAGRVSISVNITHTYRGDLILIAGHGDQTWKLHDRAGSGADDLVQVFPIDGDVTPAGEWTLSVADRASRDTGTLNSWSVVVTP